MAVPWCADVKIPSGFFGWRAGRGPWPDDTDCVKISGPQTGMQHTRAFVQSSLHLDTGARVMEGMGGNLEGLQVDVPCGPAAGIAQGDFSRG